jgi:hypothetical protein
MHAATLKVCMGLDVLEALCAVQYARGFFISEECTSVWLYDSVTIQSLDSQQQVLLL